MSFKSIRLLASPNDVLFWTAQVTVDATFLVQPYYTHAQVSPVDTLVWVEVLF